MEYNWLKRLTSAAALVFSTVLMLTVISCQDSSTKRSGAPAHPGEALFVRLACSSCHGAGPSQLGPHLNGIFGTEVILVDGTAVVVDEFYLRESILDPHAKIVKGYSPVMPLFEGILSDDEVNHLIDYLKQL